MSGAVTVLGAGGHGKVVVATLRAVGIEVTAVLDDDRELWGRDVLGVVVDGPTSRLQQGMAVAAVGDNHARARLVDGLGDGITWIPAVHPSAVVHGSVALGAGGVVFAGAVLQPDSVLGRHVIVNTGATVDHDCALGDFVHLGPGVHVGGHVTVGEGAFLGIGAAVLPGRTVGTGAVVGAGAVVVHDVAAGVKVAGVPARPLPVREGGR